MARASWIVFSAVVGFFFCASFFTCALGLGREQGPVSVALFAGQCNALAWAVVLLPLFLLGAWLRRRRCGLKG